jgi:hypothetical protein
MKKFIKASICITDCGKNYQMQIIIELPKMQQALPTPAQIIPPVEKHLSYNIIKSKRLETDVLIPVFLRICYSTPDKDFYLQVIVRKIQNHFLFRMTQKEITKFGYTNQLELKFTDKSYLNELD